MSSFYNYINEATLPWSFKAEIKGVIYEIVRTQHLRDKRVNDSKPKDFKMSKAKYQRLFDLSMDNMTKNIAYTIT